MWGLVELKKTRNRIMHIPDPQCVYVKHDSTHYLTLPATPTQYQTTCSQCLCSICAVSCSIYRQYLCSISQYSHSILQYFTVFTQYLFVPHRAVLQYRLPSVHSWEDHDVPNRLKLMSVGSFESTLVLWDAAWPMRSCTWLLIHHSRRRSKL